MRLEFNKNPKNYVNVGDAGVIYRVQDGRDVVKAGRIDQNPQNHDVVGEEKPVSRMKNGEPPVKLEKGTKGGDKVVYVDYERSTNPVRIIDPNRIINHRQRSRYTVSADEPFVFKIANFTVIAKPE